MPKRKNSISKKVENEKSRHLDAIEHTHTLVQAEKLAALGTIAAGVSHEINNPLSFLLSNIESLETYMKTFRILIDRYQQYVDTVKLQGLSLLSQDMVREISAIRDKSEVDFMLSDYESLLKDSLEGVFRIKEIISGLQTFSRPTGKEIEAVDVNHCIEVALRVVSNELKYKCLLSKELGQVPEVNVNAGLLLQVFINILVNAAKSIHEKGTIKVSTYCDFRDVHIKIIDSGCGISEDDQKKLFMPFFSRNHETGKMGLGLSVSYGIIKEMGGRIEVQSSLGVGSAFTISIPHERRKS